MGGARPKRILKASRRHLEGISNVRKCRNVIKSDLAGCKKQYRRIIEALQRNNKAVDQFYCLKTRKADNKVLY